MISKLVAVSSYFSQREHLVFDWSHSAQDTVSSCKHSNRKSDCYIHSTTSYLAWLPHQNAAGNKYYIFHKFWVVRTI